MSEGGANGLWLIAATFLVAFLLAVYPLPAWLGWARPEWVALVLIYWVVALPQRVGVLAAFAVGVVVDILEGAVLGQNALALSVVAFLALALYQRLRVFNLWQQAAVVFMLLGINQLLVQWVQNATSQGAQTLIFLMPALMGALLWPGTLILLRQLRRRYQVS
ncbi:MAG: rod shape-determining protein MreD [Lysobacterales bacterium]